jgi:ABC-type multidrug transport system ATPase subunit
MPILEAHRLLKKLGPDYALGPLDLQLAPAEILGVLGPSGSGKTTLLRLLWGFLRPDAGSITVLGLTPHLAQIRIRRRAGFVGSPARFPTWMKTGEFLAFTAGFYPTYDADHASAMLDRMRLDRSRRIEQLDEEERVGLSLVAALSHYPELVLLDEPVCALPSDGRRAILDFLKETSEQGAGIVVSSRTPEDLDPIADRVIMLDRGHVVREADVPPLCSGTKVTDRPRTATKSP